jgi:hypothetical protein
LIVHAAGLGRGKATPAGRPAPGRRTRPSERGQALRASNKGLNKDVLLALREKPFTGEKLA